MNSITERVVSKSRLKFYFEFRKWGNNFSWRRNVCYLLTNKSLYFFNRAFHLVRSNNPHTSHSHNPTSNSPNISTQKANYLQTRKVLIPFLLFYYVYLILSGNFPSSPQNGNYFVIRPTTQRPNTAISYLSGFYTSPIDLWIRWIIKITHFLKCEPIIHGIVG